MLFSWFWAQSNIRRVRRGIDYRRCASSDGWPLGYAVYGPKDGQPVLFLAGLGMDGRMWWAILPSFARRGFRCLLLDTRGIGRTQMDPDFTIAKYVEDARAVLQSEKIARAHVIGCSMGSLAGLHLASEHPELVGRLELITPVDRVDETMRDLINRFRRVIQEEGFLEYARQGAPYLFHPATLFRWGWLIRLVSRDFMKKRINKEPIFAHFAALEKYEGNPDLSLVKGPALILDASDDRIAPSGAGERLRQNLPSSFRVTVPKTAHGLLAENPFLCRKKMIDFLLGRKKSGEP